MASYELWVTATLTDAQGDQAKMRWPLGLTADTATLANLATDIAAFLTALGAPGTMTNAKVTSVVVSMLYEKATPTAGAVDAAYPSVTSGAHLNFLNSAGGRGSITIPAPTVTTFGTTPNDATVNPAGDAAPLIAWYTGHVYDQGALLNVFNGGVRTGRHARRRAQHRVP